MRGAGRTTAPPRTFSSRRDDSACASSWPAVPDSSGAPCAPACSAKVIPSTVLTRSPRTPDEVAWTPDGKAGAWASALDGADAIVNLAGEGIADRRWNERASGHCATAAWCRLAAWSPRCASRRRRRQFSSVRLASGTTARAATNASPNRRRPVRTSCRQLCVEWEREAEQASATTRVVLVRTALVLHPDGGALEGDAPALQARRRRADRVRARSTCRGSISMIGFDSSCG